MKKSNLSLLIEYTNIAIIFGYIAMFSSLCPYAPALAFAGFYYKILTDIDVLSTIY